MLKAIEIILLLFAGAAAIVLGIIFLASVLMAIAFTAMLIWEVLKEIF